jgi:uncharacterized RDD family membrane protein YckC
VTAVRAQDVARRVHGTPPPAETTRPRYVGLVTRAIAFVVDAAIVNTIAVVVATAVALVLSLFPLSDNLRTVLVAVGGALFFVWVIAYFATFWSTTGQTPGNRVMHIRVTRPAGTTLRPRRALVRVVGVLLAALPLFAGFIPILFTDRRRGFADWLADTVVVNDQD